MVSQGCIASDAENLLLSDKRPDPSAIVATSPAIGSSRFALVFPRGNPHWPTANTAA
jgi:hypothetical protein